MPGTPLDDAIEAEQPYDDTLDPLVRAFVQLTFRETRRELPEAQWLALITDQTPAAVASLLHATAHHAVRWDRPFGDVLSFGLGVPTRQPYWSAALETHDNLLSFGSLGWASIFLAWNAAGAELLQCDEEGGVTSLGTLDGFVSEGIDRLLHEASASGPEAVEATRVLDAYREHIAAWLEKLQRSADAHRDAAARALEAMEALDLDGDGAAAALDELGATEARLAARAILLEGAAARSRYVLSRLPGGPAGPGDRQA